MGAAAIPLAVAAGGGLLQLGVGAQQFSMQRSAAAIERGEAEVAAKQEELGATAREADRKAQLARALASQRASAGAKGIAAFEGSPLTILEADIQAEKEATERDVFATELSAFMARTGAKTREKLQKRAATLGLLGTVGQTATQAGLALIPRGK